MGNYIGKKLLILGGFHQHCKVVEAAKRMGLTVYVADYLPEETAPAKQIADEAFLINVYDVDGLYQLCVEKQVDAVINVCSDAAQLPYQQLCERLNLPCFGTYEQYKMFSDKRMFKKLCEDNGVDTIVGYSEEDFKNREVCLSRVKFPVFIKPCDGRGSRGQSVCYCYEEAMGAIEFARANSRVGHIIIEQYMEDKPDFSMTYLVVNGEPILTRTIDRFLGKAADHMDKSAIGAIAPSIYSDFYLATVARNVEKMIRNAGIKNAPLFIQGFVDGDTIRFYDPGLRFSGAEYERQYHEIYGLDLMEALIEFALTGDIPKKFEKLDKTAKLKGRYAFNLHIPVRPGTISAVVGIEKIKSMTEVISVFTNYNVGDTVGEFYNASQRFCEVDFICDSIEGVQRLICEIYDCLSVINDCGENMVFSKFDPCELNNRE